MSRFAWSLVGVVAVVAMGCGSSMSTPMAAPTVDVTGKWTGTWVATNPSLGSGQVEMNIKQTANQWAGMVNITGTPLERSGFAEGNVSGNQFTVNQPTSITGSLTVQGDSMSGILQGQLAGRVNLNRQK